ncbi:MAG TPA: GNAT family N-acetyltransferase [Acidimicrobiales bacterium]|nr:GNAT family N-acetyltransferase [Acidimicrobiales bacterium]
MELRRVRLTDSLVEPLLQGLAEEYGRRYGLSIGAGEMAAAPAQQFEPPDGAFVVLLDDGRTVAGGGVRRLSSTTCEVKRMWTAPDRRRRGHATAVLRALEEAARDLGYRHIRLVTGPAQPEAIALYGAYGYVRIPVVDSDWGAVAFEGDLGEPVGAPDGALRPG